MSKKRNSPDGNMSPERLKAILSQAIDSGLVFGVMIVSGQTDTRLATELGDYPLVPGDYVMLGVGQAVSDEPGVKWLALTTPQKGPEGPRKVSNE